MRIVPRTLTDLRVHGVAEEIPAQRCIPYVASAVLVDPRTEEVLFPPFDFDGDVLVGVGDIGPAEWFEDVCDRGWASKLPSGTEAPTPRSDGCFFFPEGTGPGEYTSFLLTAQKLEKCANDHMAQGDVMFSQDRPEEALWHYERAASCVQTHETYTRMLRVLPPGRRRDRILKMLDYLDKP